MRVPDWKQRFEAAFDRIDRRSGGAVRILRTTISRFGEARGSEAAASLAYYAFFSLFPLGLLLLSLSGFLFTDQRAYVTTNRVIQAIFPTLQNEIMTTLRSLQLIEIRSITGLVGLLGAFWASSGMFNALLHNINLAWPRALSRSSLHRRLIALLMVFVLIVLLFLSIFTSAIGNVLPNLSLSFRLEFAQFFSGLWLLIINFLPWLFTFLLFLALYRWVPKTRVRWKAALRGAFVATIAWELAKVLFAAYLNSGLIQFNAVYGPLSTLVVFMFWIYLSSLITLFGAHLTAAIDQTTA